MDPQSSSRSSRSSSLRYSVVNFGAALLESTSSSPQPFDVILRHVSRRVKTNKKENIALLDDVSLFFKPGTMTLVLGAPGCGKTTLFKVLANHGAKKKKTQTGQVLFNKRPPNHKTHHQSVAYITQEDTHFATLSVRETLRFSLECKAPKNMSERAKNARVDLLLDLLDLRHVQTTIVGDELTRGISGGQRKRVTIGVSLTGNPSLLLMDEPTTGLDATTALEVITSMRTVCDNMQTPVVAALLQPSPEICEMFDNLVILSKGRVAYFGTYANAIPYFARYGLEGGKFQSDPEFLQEVVEYSHKYSDKTTDQMINLYRESPEYQETMEILGPEIIPISEEQEKEEKSEKAPLHTYPTSFVKQIKINMWREWVMTKRNLANLRNRLLNKLIVGILAGSLFFQLGNEQKDLRTRLGVLYFATLYIPFSNVGNIAPFYRDRSVFYLQRDQKYYSPLAYIFSKTCIEILLVIIECILFGTSLYWMVGLREDVGRFFYFLLVVMACDLFSVVLCRLASTAISSQQVAAGMVPFNFGVLVLFSGFVVPPPSIPDWWIWIYYINPFHYALESCMINEFVGTKFHCSISETLPPPFDPSFSLPFPQGFENNSICAITNGEQQLKNLNMKTDLMWRWPYLAVMLSFSIFVVLVNLVAAAKINNTKIMKTRKSSNIEEVPLEISSDPIEKSSAGNGAFMTWQNLSYTVDVKVKEGGKGRKKKEKLKLLDGITGCVRPGMLMALMGPSGAGKSTLLDVLANRKTEGEITGKITINGNKRDKFFNRYATYVEQQDTLLPLATIYETVRFSAQLRLPREFASSRDIEMRIRDTLAILDLDSIQDMYAGNLSMEQRKRLTIAVELVTDPHLLFLDEPTSGLDAQAAMKVMQVVKRVADTGRAVICTIHQPSLSVFSFFDHLLLLKHGGKTIYFGPTGQDCQFVLGYFASIGWQCEPKRNPADFILEIASISKDAETILEEEKQDPEEAYKISKLKEEMESKVTEIPPDIVATIFEQQYASSIWRQLGSNLSREWKNTIRRKQDNILRWGRGAMMGIFLGTVFLQLPHDPIGANDRIGMFYFILTCVGAIANDAVPNIVDNRAVFYREQASGTYRPLSYLFALLVTDLPSTLITTLLFTTLTYWIVGLYPSALRFFFFVWVIFVFYCLSISWVIFLSLVSPSGEIALAISNASVVFFSLYAGFVITRGNIPNYWIWMYYFSFFHYPLEAISLNELEHNFFECPNGKGEVPVYIPSVNTTKQYCPITNGEQLIGGMDFKMNAKELDMGITLAFWAGIIVACYIALRFVRHIKR